MSSFQCVECNAPYEAAVHQVSRKRFCSSDCHRKWANRRNIRGALVYDFMMTMRYDRLHENEARSILQNLCRSFRDGDKHHRDGRRSWLDFERAKAAVPLAFSITGDGR